MNQRISFGKNPPLSFRESLPFDQECPYKLRCKDFSNDDIAPPHCAETMEIDVCCGITGEAVVEQERLPLCGNAVLVIPPGAVHAITVRAGPGRVYVLQISFEALRPLVNVELLLELCGRSAARLPRLCACFDRLHSLVLELIRQDDEPLARTRTLLEVLETLFAQAQPAPLQPGPERSGALQRVLHWTEDNFTHPISLTAAARTAGFTKTYFCTWFKAQTGLTYNCYLNQVRISHACQLLAQTGSIQTACYSSGFQDMSYFIQRFKRTQGITPKAYLRNYTSPQPAKWSR